MELQAPVPTGILCGKCAISISEQTKCADLSIGGCYLQLFVDMPNGLMTTTINGNCGLSKMQNTRSGLYSRSGY